MWHSQNSEALSFSGFTLSNKLSYLSRRAELVQQWENALNIFAVGITNSIVS